MVKGMFSFVVRLRAFSTTPTVSYAPVATCDLLTFVTMIVAQPRGREGPGIQYFLEAVNHQRLSTYYNVQQD